MRDVLPTLLGILALSATISVGTGLKFIKDAASQIGSEIQTIKDPVDKTVTQILSSKCTEIKTLLGQEYRQVSTPDLSKLTLNYLTRSIKISYNLSEAAELLPSSRWFRAQDKIIFYLHGFTEDPTKRSYTNINEAFLKQGDYNVVALDSSSLIGVDTLYIGATTNVRYIGEKLGQTLANMVKVGADPASIYLIGHSLGSHIASFAGKTFTKLTGKRVGRITGLDPAGPCFTALEDGLKLNATDADFVDVIHTDAGVFGLTEPRGHVDYYVNSGSLQPKCITQTCSHNRAWWYYAETVVNPTAMPAISCRSWDEFKKGRCNTNDVSYMGFMCDPKTRGIYYLQTAGDSPFGLGEDGLKYINTDGLLKNIGSSVGLI